MLSSGSPASCAPGRVRHAQRSPRCELHRVGIRNVAAGACHAVRMRISMVIALAACGPMGPAPGPSTTPGSEMGLGAEPPGAEAAPGSEVAPTDPDPAPGPD